MSDFYTVSNAELIEDFDADQYGNHWYSVKFAEDDETYLWLAKKEPEVGQKVYGHMEPTKSGKRMRFKKDPLPDGAQAADTTTSQQGPKEEKIRDAANDRYLKDASTMPLDVYRVRANINGLPENSSQRRVFFQNVRQDALELLQLIEEVRDGTFAEKTNPKPSSGIEKARATANEIRSRELSPEEATEMLGGLGAEYKGTHFDEENAPHEPN